MADNPTPPNWLGDLVNVVFGKQVGGAVKPTLNKTTSPVFKNLAPKIAQSPVAPKKESGGAIPFWQTPEFKSFLKKTGAQARSSASGGVGFGFGVDPSPEVKGEMFVGWGTNEEAVFEGKVLRDPAGALSFLKEKQSAVKRLYDNLPKNIDAGFVPVFGDGVALGDRLYMDGTKGEFTNKPGAGKTPLYFTDSKMMEWSEKETEFPMYLTPDYAKRLFSDYNITIRYNADLIANIDRTRPAISPLTGETVQKYATLPVSQPSTQKWWSGGKEADATYYGDVGSTFTVYRKYDPEKTDLLNPETLAMADPVNVTIEDKGLRSVSQRVGENMFKEFFGSVSNRSWLFAIPTLVTKLGWMILSSEGRTLLDELSSIVSSQQNQFKTKFDPITGSGANMGTLDVARNIAMGRQERWDEIKRAFNSGLKHIFSLSLGTNSIKSTPYITELMNTLNSKGPQSNILQDTVSYQKEADSQNATSLKWYARPKGNTEETVRLYKEVLDELAASYTRQSAIGNRDPFAAYTWMADPDKQKQAYYAVAQAQVQKWEQNGGWITQLERQQILDRLVDPTVEFIGGAIFDWTMFLNAPLKGAMGLESLNSKDIAKLPYQWERSFVKGVTQFNPALVSGYDEGMDIGGAIFGTLWKGVKEGTETVARGAKDIVVEAAEEGKLGKIGEAMLERAAADTHTLYDTILPLSIRGTARKLYSNVYNFTSSILGHPSDKAYKSIGKILDTIDDLAQDFMKFEAEGLTGGEIVSAIRNSKPGKYHGWLTTDSNLFTVVNDLAKTVNPTEWRRVLDAVIGKDLLERQTLLYSKLSQKALKFGDELIETTGIEELDNLITAALENVAKSGITDETGLRQAITTALTNYASKASQQGLTADYIAKRFAGFITGEYSQKNAAWKGAKVMKDQLTGWITNKAAKAFGDNAPVVQKMKNFTSWWSDAYSYVFNKWISNILTLSPRFNFVYQPAEQLLTASFYGSGTPLTNLAAILKANPDMIDELVDMPLEFRQGFISLVSDVKEIDDVAVIKFWKENPDAWKNFIKSVPNYFIGEQNAKQAEVLENLLKNVGVSNEIDKYKLLRSIEESTAGKMYAQVSVPVSSPPKLSKEMRVDLKAMGLTPQDIRKLEKTPDIAWQKLGNNPKYLESFKGTKVITVLGTPVQDIGGVPAPIQKLMATHSSLVEAMRINVSSNEMYTRAWIATNKLTSDMKIVNEPVLDEVLTQVGKYLKKSGASAESIADWKNYIKHAWKSANGDPVEFAKSLNVNDMVKGTVKVTVPIPEELDEIPHGLEAAEAATIKAEVGRNVNDFLTSRKVNKTKTVTEYTEKTVTKEVVETVIDEVPVEETIEVADTAKINIKDLKIEDIDPKKTYKVSFVSGEEGTQHGENIIEAANKKNKILTEEEQWKLDMLGDDGGDNIANEYIVDSVYLEGKPTTQTITRIDKVPREVKKTVTETVKVPVTKTVTKELDESDIHEFFENARTEVNKGTEEILDPDKSPILKQISDAKPPIKKTAQEIRAQVDKAVKDATPLTTIKTVYQEELDNSWRDLNKIKLDSQNNFVPGGKTMMEMWNEHFAAHPNEEAKIAMGKTVQAYEFEIGRRNGIVQNLLTQATGGNAEALKLYAKYNEELDNLYHIFSRVMDRSTGLWARVFPMYDNPATFAQFSSDELANLMKQQMVKQIQDQSIHAYQELTRYFKDVNEQILAGNIEIPHLSYEDVMTALGIERIKDGDKIIGLKMVWKGEEPYSVVEEVLDPTSFKEFMEYSTGIGLRTEQSWKDPLFLSRSEHLDNAIGKAKPNPIIKGIAEADVPAEKQRFWDTLMQSESPTNASKTYKEVLEPIIHPYLMGETVPEMGIRDAKTLSTIVNPWEMTKEEFLSNPYPKPTKDGYIVLYTTIGKDNDVLNKITREGLQTKYALGNDAPKGMLWATSGPTDYNSSEGLVAFQIPKNSTSLENVDKAATWTITQDIPPEDILATYPVRGVRTDILRTKGNVAKRYEESVSAAVSGRTTTIQGGTRSWDNFKLYKGETVSPKDVAPLTNANGDVILYHGTSSNSVNDVITSKTIKAKDVGLGTVTSKPDSARKFVESRLTKGDNPAVVEIVLDKEWIGKQKIFGAGDANAFYIGAKGTTADIPPEAIKSIRLYHAAQKFEDLSSEDVMGILGKAAQGQTATDVMAGFEGSKVIDEAGKPLVVYHGTKGDFDEFDVSKSRDIGIHFGTAEQARIRTLGGEGGNIRPVYLNIQNPLELKDGEWTSFRIMRQAEERGVKFSDATKKLVDIDLFNYNKQGMKISAEEAVEMNKIADESLKAVAQDIKNAGFDGIKYLNTIEGKGYSWIVFDKSQIKSAIGETTTNLGKATDDVSAHLQEVMDYFEHRYIRGDANYGMPLSAADVPEDAKQVANLKVSQVSKNAGIKNMLNEWEKILKQKLKDGTLFRKTVSGASDEMLESANLKAVQSMADMRDKLLHGGKVAGYDMEGAIPYMQYAMRVPNENVFDQLIKTVVPFWGFASRGSATWARIAANHPQLLILYSKFQQFSKQQAYKYGAVDSKGRQLQSVAGKFASPVGNTQVWVDPMSVSPFLRYFLPPRNMQASNNAEEMSDFVGFMNWFTDYGQQFGMRMSPLISIGLSLLPGFDDTYTSQSWNQKATNFGLSLAIPPDLICPGMWDVIDVMGRKMFRMDMSDSFRPQVSYMDYLVETEIMKEILGEMRAEPDPSKKLEIAKSIDGLLKERENNPRYARILEQMRNSDYAKQLAGWVIGIYGKPFTPGDSEVYAIRDEYNRMVAAINNEAKLMLLFPKTSSVDLYNQWQDKRYNAPEGVLWSARNAFSWVQSETGEVVEGTARREQISKTLDMNFATSQYFAERDKWFKWSEEQERALPVGTPYDDPRRVAIRKELWEYLTELENQDTYKDAQKAWTMGYKPQELVYQHYQNLWWELLYATYPKWDKENDQLYADYQASIKAWYLQLPKFAKELKPIYNARVVESMSNPSGGQDVLGIVPQLMGETNEKGFLAWQMSNDTPEEAVFRAWESLYSDPYFLAVDGLKGFTRQKSSEDWLMANPKPTLDQLAAEVVRLYGGKFKPDEIQEALHSYGAPRQVLGLEESRELGKTETDTKYDRVFELYGWIPPDMKAQFYETYALIGGDSSILDTFFNVANSNGMKKEDLDELYINMMRTLEQLGISKPDPAQLTMLSEAQKLNDQFKETMSSQFGDGWEDIVNQYQGMTSSVRKKWRKMYPDQYEIVMAYYEMRTQFGRANPSWASVYLSSKKSTSYYGGGYSSRGGGGGRSLVQSGSGAIVPVGFRSATDARDLLAPRKKSGRKSGAKTPSWVAAMQNEANISPALEAEIQGILAGDTTINTATASYLQNIAGRYPQYATQITEFISQHLQPQ